MLESRFCKKIQWIGGIEDGNNMSVERSELVWYVRENEKLKLKVASSMEEAKANEEEIKI